MYFTGIIIAVSTFLVIGIFHPIVIKVEYYWGTRPWWIFLVLGIAAIAAALFVANVIASALLGVVGASLLWSIGELFEQRKRVEKGWFPRNPKRAVCISLFLSMITSVNVSASNNGVLSDSSRVFSLDEIVVVSQPKEHTPLRSQPMSSTVFTSDEMERLGIRDLGELSDYVPSFNMPKYGSRLTSSMYVRGIGSRVNSPAVGIYIDGIPLVNKASYNFHTFDVERIDILRGSQGTLYGMNNEGGLVRMYSRNPMYYQATDIKLGLGTRLYRNAEVSHYAKLSNKIALSVGAFYEGQNGFFSNLTNGERADNYDEAGGKFRLIYAPSKKLKFDYVTNYQFVNQNAFPYGLLDITTNSIASPSANRENSYKRNMLNMGLNIEYAYNALVLHSTTSFQYTNDHMRMDQDYMAADLMHLDQKQHMSALTQELTLKSNRIAKWHRTTGIFGSYQWLRTQSPVYFDNDFTTSLGNTIQTTIQNAIGNRGSASFSVGDMSVPSLFHTPQLNIGWYHESNIDITRRLTATIGLRYDYSRESIDYDAAASMAFNASVMGMNVNGTLSSSLINDTHDSYDQLLPKFGLTYTFDSTGSNVYAIVSKGYRAGGYNIQMFSDILQTELMSNYTNAMRGSYEVPHEAEDYENVNNTISYKPETSWNYEVGAHLNLFDNKLHADLAAFYMQISNQQLSVMAGNYGFGRMMVNAGKSHSYGIEASLRGLAIGDKLSWALNYSLTEAFFKDYKDDEVDYEGKRVPFVPMHSLSARLDYTIALGSNVFRSLIIGADMNAQGRIYWDEANTYSQPFYAILGAHAGLDINNVGLRIWCRNITDTHYATFAFDSSASGRKSYFAQRGMPIQAGIDINIHL